MKIYYVYRNELYPKKEMVDEEKRVAVVRVEDVKEAIKKLFSCLETIKDKSKWLSLYGYFEVEFEDAGLTDEFYKLGDLILKLEEELVEKQNKKIEKAIREIKKCIESIFKNIKWKKSKNLKRK